MNKASLHTRYSRQTILTGFGEAAQQKLAAAKVLVIGAGGLGCPALQYLAAAGVGTIGLVDDDLVSLSNLHRQALYTTADIGRFKTDVAAERLRAMNPEITVTSYQLRLGHDEALLLFPQYDMVLDGTDNFASRYLINDACVLLGKPLVYGAVSQYQGQVSVFNVTDKNGISTQYRHLFPHPPKAGEVASCAEAGVLGVLPGIIGTMQAAEVIKVITGVGEPLVNKLLTYDVLTHNSYVLHLSPLDEGTAATPATEAAFLAMNYEKVCGGVISEKVNEVDGPTLIALANNTDAVVIDVREKGEQPLLQNVSHRQVPMSVFSKAIESIEEPTVFLICQHGMRSQRAGELIKQRFGSAKEVYSLEGGIAKWATALGIE